MQEQNHSKLNRVVSAYNKVYKALLWVFGFVVVIGIGSGITTTFANDSENPITGAFGTFSGFICQIYDIMGAVVGGLAVVTLIAAGVVYGASGGNTGKDGLSIGTAKTMMVSAIAGASLYLLGGFFLGQCGIGGALNSPFFGGAGSGNIPGIFEER